MSASVIILKRGRKPEYPEKTPDDQPLEKVPHARLPRPGLEPTFLSPAGSIPVLVTGELPLRHMPPHTVISLYTLYNVFCNWSKVSSIDL